MGQDSSCGICGKHYQECNHYLKEHIPNNGSNGKTLCGNKRAKLILDTGWENVDLDPDDLCEVCLKIYGPLKDPWTHEELYE